MSCRLSAGHRPFVKRLCVAMQKGITVLGTWEHPLRTEADVDVVGVGKKTRDKIVEIMETGRLERNAMRAADPTWQVSMLQAHQLCSFNASSNALRAMVLPAGEAAVRQRVGLRRHCGRALVPGGLQDAGRCPKALRPDDAAAGGTCAIRPCQLRSTSSIGPEWLFSCWCPGRAQVL